MEQPRTADREAPPAGSRDVFRLAVLIVMLFALFLGVLGIAAYNSTFVFLPLVRRQTTASTFRTGTWVACAVAVYDQPRRAVGMPRAETIS